MEKKKIQEVIVVEGKHDTEKLKKYFDCETIETNGTHLGKEVMERIRYAAKTRGVIVLTDPDSPGNRIRHRIVQEIPGCKNAFVQKKDARTDKKVGVEHAEEAVLKEAIEHCASFMKQSEETLTSADMYELGLSGENSTEKREFIGSYFHIGMGNARTMKNRLNGLGIDKQSVREALKTWKEK